MSAAERRRKVNRKNIVKFFGGKDRFDLPRLSGLERFPPGRFLELAKTYLEFERELEQIFSYARRFKQAVREIDEEDVQEALAELHVRDVMGS